MTSAAPAARRMPLLRKLMFSGTLLVLVVLLLEAVLRLTITNGPAFEEQPAREPGTRAFNFMLNIRNPLIVMPKPAGRYRVMVFGESAADGWHIRGFPTWMNELVRETRPPRPVEVFNFGVVGSNSTRIREWYFPALELDPDLVILYIGNNEMVEYTSLNPTEHPWLFAVAEFVKQRSYVYHVLGAGYSRLMDSGGVVIAYEMLGKALRAGDTLTPESRRRAAERLYHDNLRDMIAAARRQGVKVVVLSPAADLSDWPPLKSAHYAALPADQEQQFSGLLSSARESLGRGDRAAARGELEAALRLDPHYAEADYSYGRVLLDGGSVEEARKYFERAQQYDDYPLRPLISFVGIAREAAEEGGAEFINMDDLLAPAAADGIIGSGLIYDYVHFTPRGNYDAARLLLDELGRRGLIPMGSGPVPAFADEMARFPLDEQYAIDLHRAEVLGFAFDNRELMARSIAAFGRVRARHPENLFASLAEAVLWCRRGETGRAAESLTRAYRASPQGARQAAAIAFGGIMEIYQGQAVVAGGPDTRWYLVPARYIADEKARESGKNRDLRPADFGSIPLGRMTAAFVWSESENRFRDVSAELARLKAEARELGSRHAEAGADLLKEGERVLRPVAMKADFKARVFIAQSADSCLVVQPLPADPLAAGVLRLKMRLVADAAAPNWMVIYWASGRDPAFREDRKITFGWPLDGRVRERDVPLDRIIPLLLDRPITSLRLDFTAAPARIELRELELRRDR